MSDKIRVEEVDTPSENTKGSNPWKIVTPTAHAADEDEVFVPSHNIAVNSTDACHLPDHAGPQVDDFLHGCDAGELHTHIANTGDAESYGQPSAMDMNNDNNTATSTS